LSQTARLFQEVDQDGDGAIFQSEIQELISRLGDLENGDDIHMPPSEHARAAVAEAQLAAQGSARFLVRCTFTDCAENLATLISARWEACGGQENFQLR